MIHKNTELEWLYDTDAAGNIILTEFLGNNTVYVPAKIDGHPVTALRDELFLKNQNIESIVFDPESSIIDIPENFCTDCNRLKKVVLPNAVKSISSGAFERCFHLQSVNIPEELVSVGDIAFASTKIETPVISKKTVFIGDEAFRTCTRIQGTLTLPESLEQLGEKAFKGCIAITNLDMRNCNSLNTIKEYTFADCSQLQTVILPEFSNTLVLLKGAFNSCIHLTNVENMKNIIRMDNEVFLNCISLRRADLRNTVHIGNSCFGISHIMDFAMRAEGISPGQLAVVHAKPGSQPWKKLRQENIHLVSSVSKLKNAVLSIDDDDEYNR